MAKGIFFNVGGCGSSIDMLNGIGSSNLVGSTVIGVNGGFNLSFAYF
jgi:hypothetical protein